MRRNVLLSLCVWGCAGAPPAAVEPAPAAPAAPVTEVAPPKEEAIEQAPPAPPPEVTLLSFRKVVDAPVHSIALGKAGRVAALGAEAWLDAGKGFEKLPAPPGAGAGDQIYFGRDNLPRVMGSVYLRWRGGAWQRAASELGRLAPPLYGVLGHDDPEVVCKPNDACIIKRLTGWKTIPPLPGTPEVVLTKDTAWAFEGKQLWRLENDAFTSFGGAVPFDRAVGLWADSANDVWVAAARGLHHFDGKAWSQHASPTSNPRALWGTASDDVWLASEGGAAHWDGQAWSRVTGASEPVEVVIGSGPKDVWLAGKSGVWKGTPP